MRGITKLLAFFPITKTYIIGLRSERRLSYPKKSRTIVICLYVKIQIFVNLRETKKVVYCYNSKIHKLALDCI